MALGFFLKDVDIDGYRCRYKSERERERDKEREMGQGKYMGNSYNGLAVMVTTMSTFLTTEMM